ncbi:MAG TPA: hypothetical protein DCL77_20810 [Prolixibacteraceae bacterium]|jgi:hypothetical protein|nr:hypothetical protein [Prolixibacteraceae bacterium]
MNFRTILLCSFLTVFSLHSFSQTQKDTIFAPEAIIPVVIDGSDKDDCWAKSDWKPINQVWIGPKVAASDFTGKYKMAWDANYLYVLVEVVDDILSDDHVNPLVQWYDDDCIELFIDENRSKGLHQFNNNAFAYHVSLTYDAIDLDANGNPVNYKNNIIAKMDTIAPHTYLWEVAVKIYDATFTLANPEKSRVTLTAKKLMGFTVAYCDNDAGTTRENFIGSMIMPSGHENDNYITADYFGSLLLKANDSATSAIAGKKVSNQLVSVFPNPAQNQIRLERLNNTSNNMVVEIRSMTGALIKTKSIANLNEVIEIGDLLPAMYLMTISSNQYIQTERIIKR